jgi:alkyl sulfatase BDS1-like metallo-beta-lactamase superfamily hydrolase
VRLVPILAPRGFMDQIASENVIAFPTWARRAAYQFGLGLPLDAKGFVTSGDGPRYSGSGNTISASGTTSLLPPTHEITYTGEVITLTAFVWSSSSRREPKRRPR